MSEWVLYSSSFRNVTSGKARASAMIFSLLAIYIFSTGAVSAEDSPSNAELYQMILDMQANQESLKQEADQARAEAAEAKRELAQTQEILKATQESLRLTEGKVIETQEVVAQTQEGLAETQAEMGTAPSSSVVRIQESDRGPYATLDFIYKRPENDRLTYALLSDDSGGQITSGVDVGTEYDPGFRAGLGYLFNRGIEGFVQFSYLETSASDSAIPVGILDLNPKLVPENDLSFDQDADLDSARASYEIDYYVLDAGFAQNLGIGDQINLRLGGGLRYAAIDDELSAFYADSPTNTISVDITNDLWGIGPRATVDVNWNIHNSGFSIFGMVGGSLLYGENDFTYFARDADPGDTDVVSFDNDENHIFTVLEANVGAGYSGTTDTFQYNLQLGYEFETWLDALSSLSFVDDTTEELFTREDTDLDLHGLFLNGTIKW